MKKYLTILLTVLMFFTSSATMFADEVEVTQNSENKEVNVQLYADVTSTYSVKIPAKFDVKPVSTTLNIFAKGDISADETLSITYKNSDVALKETGTSQTKHPDVPLTLTGEAASLSWNQIDKAEYGNNAHLAITITHDVIAAGYWTTDLPITIALNKAN